MKIKLDSSNRKFIELEVELGDSTLHFKYYEQNTKQIKSIRALASLPETKLHEIEAKTESIFFENLRGDKKHIEAVVEFYEEEGNIYDFMSMCNKELGKLRTKA